MKYDYDLICIGLGPAGMAVSIMGSEMGLKVCGIEKNKIGGECMNCGCIPSKALLRMAQFRHNITGFAKKRLSETPLPAVGDIFTKIADDLKYINEKKTMNMFDKVDLILGEGAASFIDDHTVAVGNRKITAKRIFIAAGTKPAILPIEGIDKVEYLTNENIFKLEKVPTSMIISGGGAIACEMAQGFQRLGCQVTLIQRSAHLLSKNDPQAAETLEETLKAEGVDLLTGEIIQSAVKTENGVSITTKNGKVVEAEKILLATGRAMNFAGFNLEAAGVVYDHKGIKVDKYLRSSKKHIYAVGDCNGYYQFSHAAMHQGMIAIMNSMMPGFMKMDFRKFVVPSTIFTEPQISQVGKSQKELDDKGIKYQTHQVRYDGYGAAIAEDIEAGFVKVFCSPAGRIYGVVIAGEGSGEMINEWAMAIQCKIPMHKVMMLQHSFPTMGFLSKRVAETWMMAKMKSKIIQKICKKMF
ncbi:MAG: NAD(P)/FAD-dependent oxidoreductase [Sedimentisphaerales bacterium]|nr:NAD(P)/FAD-dependent oxidoreductase [Sedimentisphaerales bacterium]